ncbi:fused MFS/spermidine synthase [Myxococcus sp. K38C18041901]|uniref:spermidine synthase n=1 Tax=Myxococcus guangdongensis TaxID=2906760 RepID=UPI0020A83009|nr:fused MFS/spermidine synthase [Myxococcus guangdongensis]MCP3057583.1 fused MFS/spermidine synthase [Myxococcus guangdongensis]
MEAPPQKSFARTYIGTLFHLWVFLGSFLLFQVELILAKRLLPSYGSSAAIWTTCLVFYQAVLVLGYFYSSRVTLAVQQGSYRWAHLIFVLLAVVVFPFRLHHFDLPPVAAILLTLTISMGWPFLALSTTSVVAQGWFTRTEHPSRADPFFLYGTSNAGALLALLSFPFLVEPALDLEVQLLVWYVGYGCFVLLAWLCILQVRTGAPTDRTAETSLNTEPRLQAPRSSRVTWMLLSASANALLLAVTNVLTLDASIPLLWILPLSLYLLTLVICFSKRPPTEAGLNRLAVGSLAIAVIAAIFALARAQTSIPSLVLHSTVLWVGCLLMHGNLVWSRPSDPRLLGSFYLHVSLGGLAGTLLLALIVPLTLGSLALPYLDHGLAGLLLLAGLAARDVMRQAQGVPRPRLAPYVSGGAALFIIAILTLSGWMLARGRIEGSRTFYGHYTVKDTGTLRLFQHGSTVHGVENLHPDERGEPLSYYHRGSPVGRVLATERIGRGQVAVVGLGIGSLAAYGRRGESWDFYELDPEVERLARQHFSLLNTSQAQIRVITGDARLRIEEAEDARYDIIVLDAFSSDFVPTHLLTREALDLYLRKLKPEGILLFHVSSRLFNLIPVLTRLSTELGVQGLVSQNETLTADELATGRSPSLWFAMSPDSTVTSILEQELPFQAMESSPDLLGRRAWTDNYVNLLHALAQ